MESKLHTGEVTSWTRWRSMAKLAGKRGGARGFRADQIHVQRTNIQENGSIEPLVDDVVMENLIVERLRSLTFSGGHYEIGSKVV